MKQYLKKHLPFIVFVITALLAEENNILEMIFPNYPLLANLVRICGAGLLAHYYNPKK